MKASDTAETRAIKDDPALKEPRKKKGANDSVKLQKPGSSNRARQPSEDQEGRTGKVREKRGRPTVLGESLVTATSEVAGRVLSIIDAHPLSMKELGAAFSAKYGQSIIAQVEGLVGSSMALKDFLRAHSALFVLTGRIVSKKRGDAAVVDNREIPVLENATSGLRAEPKADGSVAKEKKQRSKGFNLEVLTSRIVSLVPADNSVSLALVTARYGKKYRMSLKKALNSHDKDLDGIVSASTFFEVQEGKVRLTEAGKYVRNEQIAKAEDRAKKHNTMSESASGSHHLPQDEKKRGGKERSFKKGGINSAERKMVEIIKKIVAHNSNGITVGGIEAAYKDQTGMSLGDTITRNNYAESISKFLEKHSSTFKVQH